MTGSVTSAGFVCTKREGETVYTTNLLLEQASRCGVARQPKHGVQLGWLIGQRNNSPELGIVYVFGFQSYNVTRQ